MTTLLSCPRKHYWACEVGLCKKDTALALRLGTAWAKATEARWSGATYDAALSYALPDGVELDAFECAKVGALLAGYYLTYAKSEPVKKLHPEEKFARDYILGFTVGGKMDGIGQLKDGRTAIIEGKTTSQSIDDHSGYWQRLRFNIQLLQYLTESRELGWDIAVIFYDVVKKPASRPLKSVTELDKDGLKIVVDKSGVRQKNKKGEWVQGGSTAKGWTIKAHRETPFEYFERLLKDVRSRPDFYFARREVPVLDDVLEDFEEQRRGLAHLIAHFRKMEVVNLGSPERAWPRNVTDDTCNFCSFKSFCLSNTSINPNRPLEGFEVKPFNQELLEESYDTETTTNSVTSE